ncbi:MAG: hypothetical protein IT203_11170 [Fimbriimonadaceae bacterium]|nr:hypothetical protein [Fimbriimonadaceae bacterium]
MMQRGSGSDRGLSEAFHDFLSGAARLLFYLGLLLGLGSVAFCVYTAMAFSGGAVSAPEAQALSNIELFQKLIISGMLAAGIGAAFLFWGEELLGGIMLIVAGLLYFSPLILTSAAGVQADNKVVQAALGTIQMGGSILGALGILLLVVDIANRIKDRAQQGAKADQLKYGKGVKEEADRQNVFMGKCWQLPFCRKFVRDKCPIYHAKRTCWKEQVGCMCEESVIRGAMEGKLIPKDEVAAAAYIPTNNKLTFEQKRERCKQCVIFNEHQKHKYRALLPTIVLGFAAFYIIFRNMLLAATGGIVSKMSQIVGTLTFSKTNSGEAVSGPFQELLLICLMFILLAYVLKLLEHLIFKLKI